MRIHKRHGKQDAQGRRKTRFDASARVSRDILLIRDPEEGKQGNFSIRYRGGETIVTTDSVQRALELLRLIEVDAIFHVGRGTSNIHLELFRAEVGRLYPNVRLMDIRAAAAGARTPCLYRPEAAPEPGNALG